MPNASIKFGGGRNTQALPDEIQDTECQDGENFILTNNSNALKPRGPLSLQGTATNAEQIRGYAQLEKADGTLSTLIQAGTVLYEWDGGSTFTSRATGLSADARLRGPAEHNFTLDDIVIITDLGKSEVVSTWDGTTYAAMATGLATGVDFFAKYCLVEDERAYFGNVTTSTDTPHLFVASQRGDNKVLSISNRPSSALNEQDPFFIPIPDLRPIRGIASGFGLIAIATGKNTFKLTGTTSKDYALASLHADSGVDGDEGLVNVGNDILVPRIGRIDTLNSTDEFGDILTDDITRWIADEISTLKEWRATFDPTTQRIYIISDESPVAYVFHKFVYDADRGRAAQQRTNVSPWSKFTTRLTFGFSTECMWRMKDPATGIMSAFIGGPTGEVYKFSEGGGQDGGVEDISWFRTSKQIGGFPQELDDVSGTVRYVRGLKEENITLTAEWSGEYVTGQSKSLQLEKKISGSFFGGDAYFGGSFYFGAAADRGIRTRFDVDGASTDLALKIAGDTSSGIEIQEIAVSLDAEEAGT